MDRSFFDIETGSMQYLHNWTGVFISALNKSISERGLGKLKNSIFESENYVIICIKHNSYYAFWGIEIEEWDEMSEELRTIVTFILLDMRSSVDHSYYIDGKMVPVCNYYLNKYKKQIYRMIQLGPWATRQSYVYTINNELHKINPEISIERLLCRFNKNHPGVILVPYLSSPIWENKDKFGNMTKRKLKGFNEPREFYVDEQDAISEVKKIKKCKIETLKNDKIRIAKRIDKINNTRIYISDKGESL